MTAYRQQALRCAAALARGPARPRDLRRTAPDAPKILLRNVYDWFIRIERGLYSLSETGEAALVTWKAHVQELSGDLADLSPGAAPQKLERGSQQGRDAQGALSGGGRGSRTMRSRPSAERNGREYPHPKAHLA